MAKNTTPKNTTPKKEEKKAVVKQAEVKPVEVKKTPVPVETKPEKTPVVKQAQEEIKKTTPTKSAEVKPQSPKTEPSKPAEAKTPEVKVPAVKKAQPKKPAAKKPAAAKPAAAKPAAKKTPATKPAANKASAKTETKPKTIKKTGLVQLDYPELNLDEHFYFFHSGNDSRAFEFMGSHPATKNGEAGVVFRVWAPNARNVSVIGDFNDWSPYENPMEKVSVGIWATFISGIEQYDNYKYSITGRDGKLRDKADPYAYHSELRPANASKYYELAGYKWNDAEWIKNKKPNPQLQPINIYEVHLGSWKRSEDGGFLPYVEIAKQLIPYVKEMGYSHIEVMPITEYPLDESWGYQVTGYFATTSRFGVPHDFMKFVDLFHQAGIGVIMDWVPAHFPKDGFGLVEFDGSPTYEYADPIRGEHAEWGTRIFDYGRNEVISFLMSSAMFWLSWYHVDGLRVDAVASMLYLDYGKQYKAPRNIHGGRENIEAIEFLRKTNEQCFKAHPNVLMIAEESTAWPMVTKPSHLGGLGFNLKWNMGWMNDTLAYMSLDPIARQHHHNKLTFTMVYAFSENYVLPLSHDEVVHGKCSLIEKMPGDYANRFAGLRAYLAFQMAHPGKKLNFMGNEFAQFVEWNFNQSLDWHLLDYEMHRAFHAYVKKLNHFYRDNKPFWEQDDSWDGFEWINEGDYQGNTLSFRRIDASGREIICLFNFSPVNCEGYVLGLPSAGTYKEIFSSNAGEWGGDNILNKPIKAQEIPTEKVEFSAKVNLPPYGAIFFEKQPDKKKSEPKTTQTPAKSKTTKKK